MLLSFRAMHLTQESANTLSSASYFPHYRHIGRIFKRVYLGVTPKSLSQGMQLQIMSHLQFMDTSLGLFTIRLHRCPLHRA